MVSTGLLACSDQNTRESFGEKREWSILQGIEQRNRDMLVNVPVFKTEERYEILGVRGFNNKNIWILLNPSSPPYYKQLPAGNYEIQKTIVDELVKSHRLSYTVEQVLSSHLRDK